MTHGDPFESALAATAEFVSAPSREDFFAKLVAHAGRTLGLDAVYIATPLPGQTRAETLAAWMDGAPIANWSYDLDGTPCAEVMAGARHCCETGARERYPSAVELQRLGAEGYVGEPILDALGRTRGFIVGSSRGPLDRAEVIQANLRILAARAGAEMAHREAMASLRLERDTIGEILQTVEAIIVVLDVEGRIGLINRKGCELLGYSEAELIGQDWFTTCLPRDMDVDAVRDIHRKVLAGDLAGNEYYENTVRTRSGAIRLIAWHNSQLREASGVAIGGLSAGEDITERRLAERRLSESEQQYRTLADSGQALIWAAGTDGLCYYFNRVWLDFTGRTLEQESGNGWAEGVHPEDFERCLNVYLTAFERREKFSMEYRLRHRDGTYHWIQDDGCPRFDSAGEFLGYIGYCLDISDRKAAERALIKERERFQLILDQAPIGIWLQDGKGKLEFVNRAFREATGVPESRFLEAAHYAELFPGDSMRQCLASDAKALASQGVSVTQERLPFADGKVHDLRVYKFVKRDARGEPEALVGLSLDITEERRVESALRASEARANSMLRAAPVGIGVVVRRVIVEANDTLLRMIGYSREELIGQPSRMLYPTQAEYEAVGRDKYAQIRLHGVGSVETRWRCKDGSLIDIILSSSPIDGADENQGVTFTAQDITARKAMEAALRESETKFHTMVDWTNDWEYWIYPNGRFCYMTPSAERFTGYPCEAFDADPRLLDAIVHPEDRAIWNMHARHFLRRGQGEDIAELDLRIVRKEGDILWIAHRCRPVFDSDGTYLGRRVTVRDITARKEAEEQIRSLAYFDPLTGLPNRRLLMDRLGHALIASNRGGRHGALLMLDLDHFKALNDTQGHDVGDRLLTEVARRITATLRQQDTVSRLGGDEYLILLEELGADERMAASEAETIAEKVRTTLGVPYDITSSEQSHYCTASIGVTLFRGQENSVDSLLKQADVALYQAKDAGRNTVRFFNPQMQAAIESRLTLEVALRQALSKDELRLYYQPQMDLEGRCVGVEALLRWCRPEHGMVSPMQFIPLAEETGLILPIGHWVVDAACAQLKAWEVSDRTHALRLAINVSARQFHQPDFVSRVRASLERSGANPARLKLELTESAFLENAEQVSERMQQLKALGVGFSLDDFGTGYSSLSYLKRLPFDQLKIDQTFVRDITTDPSDAAIVMAILAMSQALGLEIVAEGVETEAQRDFLRRNGCHAFQGYLFGKPSPVEDLNLSA